MTADPRSRRRILLFAGTIGVVAAIAVLIRINVAIDSAKNVATDSANTACLGEYRYVQAALDAYMATNNLTTLPASSGTADMTAPVPLYHGNGTMFDPNYVRDPQTRWSYTWDQMGHITAIGPGPAGAVPAGCVVSGG